MGLYTAALGTPVFYKKGHMKITFFGAAHEVTGSCFLLEAEGVRFLVDCGMFQGGREADEKNRRFPQFDPEAIDFVLLTHAHIDHSGLLPRLTTLGFRGPIYCTTATADLLQVMLLDSAHIQEKEAEWVNDSRHKKHSRKRAELAPLYTVIQAQNCIKHIKAVDYDTPVNPHPQIRVSFRDAGHILGSAILEVWIEQAGATQKWVFSGDLGMPARPIMNDPTVIEEADYLLVESTYGNRAHKDMAATIEELVQVVNDTFERKHGNVIIPAFAVGRTQEILYLLTDLIRQGRIPKTTAIVVDSPMATRATELTLKHRAILDPESRSLLDWERDNSGASHIRFTESTEDSMALSNVRQGTIIISASGMCDAGRIKHHLKRSLPRAECSVIIVGFQAFGSLGRKLVDGADEVRIFGETIPVRADIYTVGGLSAHADQRALMDWLKHFKKPPRKTFVVHGEHETAQGFAELIQRQLGWSVEVPMQAATFDL